MQDIINNSFLIDSKELKTKNNVIDKMVEFLGFKDTFAYNWDSFEEILMRSSLNKNVIFYNSKYLLKNEKTSKSILKDILNDYNLEHEYKFYIIKQF